MRLVGLEVPNSIVWEYRSSAGLDMAAYFGSSSREECLQECLAWNEHCLDLCLLIEVVQQERYWRYFDRPIHTNCLDCPYPLRLKRL